MSATRLLIGSVLSVAVLLSLSPRVFATDFVFSAGSYNPDANRFQRTCPSPRSRPETIHTSPSNVTAAARPSEKKSTSETRTLRRHGFGSGSVTRSTT